MNETIKINEKFYNNSYKTLGIKAQRRYPNEELCRFMGRNFFDKDDAQDRSRIKILETGCGSGANIWMIAKEGFDAYGIDLSDEGILLAQKMLDNYGVHANLSVQDMCFLKFEDSFFDVVFDVFSSNCLDKISGKKYLTEVFRVLKPGGVFFSYFPSKGSEAYQYPGKASLLDSDTLEKVLRTDSPFYGCNHPFRFFHPREYEEALLNTGFEIQYSEVVNRTYNKRQEIFELVVIEAKKL